MDRSAPSFLALIFFISFISIQSQFQKCRKLSVTMVMCFGKLNKMNGEDMVLECINTQQESLNMSHRGLVVLPPGVSRLVTLKKLFLNNNQLILPPDEVTLRHLSHNLCTVFYKVATRKVNEFVAHII